MGRFIVGNHVPQDARLRSIKRRVLWSFAEAAYKVPRLRWRFARSLTYREGAGDTWEFTECHGAAGLKHGLWTLTIVPVASDWGTARTCIHELAHAVLGACQREETFVGDAPDHHDEVFVALRRLVKRHYLSERGPPVTCSRHCAPRA